MKLPRTDSLILLAFLVCVALWAVSKCSARRSEFTDRLRRGQEEEQEDRPAKIDSSTLRPSPAPVTSTTQPLTPQPPPPPQSGVGTPQPGNKPLRPTPAPSTPAPTTPDATPKAAPPAKPGTAAPGKGNASVLYVTIDGLKLRKQPNLKSDVITTLELYESVEFLGKKSEKPEEISLGYEKVTDYWVKVRSKSGKEGWVFGAGVHYYKMKRKGVME